MQPSLKGGSGEVTYFEGSPLDGSAHPALKRSEETHDHALLTGK